MHNLQYFSTKIIVANFGRRTDYKNYIPNWNGPDQMCMGMQMINNPLLLPFVFQI